MFFSQKIFLEIFAEKLKRHFQAFMFSTRVNPIKHFRRLDHSKVLAELLTITKGVS